MSVLTEAERLTLNDAAVLAESDTEREMVALVRRLERRVEECETALRQAMEFLDNPPSATHTELAVRNVSAWKTARRALSAASAPEAPAKKGCGCVNGHSESCPGDWPDVPPTADTGPVCQSCGGPIERFRIHRDSWVHVNRSDGRTHDAVAPAPTKETP